MKRRRFILSLLLGLSVNFGIAPTGLTVCSVRAADIAQHRPTCLTFGGQVCGSLTQWLSYATKTAVHLMKVAEEEAACRADIKAQAKAKPVKVEPGTLPAWVTFGLVTPGSIARDTLPWVGPLSSDPARSADLSFAYAAHSWLSVTGHHSQAAQTVREESTSAAAASAMRAWTRNFSHLAADPRHSTGSDEVVALNNQNEGLTAAAPKTVTDEQVMHWFEDYTFGYAFAPHDMLTGLSNSRPIRRPAAIAPLVDEFASASDDVHPSHLGELGDFETLLDGPHRFVFLRTGAEPVAAATCGNVASLALRDAASLAAEEAEREARLQTQALLTSLADGVHKCGAALTGLAQQLAAIAQQGGAANRQDERVAEEPADRHDAADARASYRPWSGCDAWDVEAGVSASPYLGL